MENTENSIDIDEQINKDLEIDEANLVGEARKQKDLLYKWGTRLSKLEDAYKKICLQLDVLNKEKYIFYSTQYEKVLSGPEVKIYVTGDAEVVKLKQTKRKLETLMDTIRHGIFSLKTKGRTISMLIDMQKLNMMG
jgi:CII-binding regulator of phage lambda lysogenization HflD